MQIETVLIHVIIEGLIFLRDTLMEFISFFSSIMGLIVGGISIFLSVFYYEKSKEMNRKTELLLNQISRKNEDLILNLYALEYKNHLSLLREKAEKESDTLPANESGYWKFKERFEWLDRPCISVEIEANKSESFYIRILNTTLDPFEINQNILDNEFYICETFLDDPKSEESKVFKHKELVCCFYNFFKKEWMISKYICKFEPEESYKFKISMLSKPQVGSDKDILVSELPKSSNHYRLKDYILNKKSIFLNKKNL